MPRSPGPKRIFRNPHRVLLTIESDDYTAFKEWGQACGVPASRLMQAALRGYLLVLESEYGTPEQAAEIKASRKRKRRMK